jgi:hypothetical protein
MKRVRGESRGRYFLKMGELFKLGGGGEHIMEEKTAGRGRGSGENQRETNKKKGSNITVRISFFFFLPFGNFLSYRNQ